MQCYMFGCIFLLDKDAKNLMNKTHISHNESHPSLFLFFSNFALPKSPKLSTYMNICNTHYKQNTHSPHFFLSILIYILFWLQKTIHALDIVDYIKIKILVHTKLNRYFNLQNIATFQLFDIAGWAMHFFVHQKSLIPIFDTCFSTTQPL